MVETSPDTFVPLGMCRVQPIETGVHAGRFFPAVVTSFALAALLAASASAAQVITIDTSGKGPITANAPIDRRYAQIKPTSVPLPPSVLDAKTRMELIRALQAEQGFAMRPFPLGHKGLTLVANGKLEPAGEAYLNMVIANGTAAKPGDRVVITDVKFDRSKIIFELNGGPDLKHRFLRHISIGAGGPDVDTPVVQGNSDQPVGSRLTLSFDGHIPELDGHQVKALLAPLISFDVKTPVQAFTDTLPTTLKDAILGHHVMVGMSTDMVLFAKGPPETKTREMDGQMPFEEWIYGKPPEEVEFVRINGNRVIRLEVAKAGEKPVIFTDDVVSGLLRTDGTPVVAAVDHTHIDKVGDGQRDADRQEAAAPPSLRKAGETLPDEPGMPNQSGNVGVMRPVQFPKPKSDDQPKPKPQSQPGSNPDSVPDSSSDSTPASSSPAPLKTPSPAQGTNQPN
jgi:hypothetical protein